MTPVGANLETPVALAAVLLPPHSSALLSHPLDTEPAPLPVVVPVAPGRALRLLACEDDGTEFVELPPHETIRGADPSSNAIENHFIMFSSRVKLTCGAKYSPFEAVTP